MNPGKYSLLFLFFFLLVACSRQPQYPSPPVAGSEVVIDASQLRPEAPEFYTYRTGGRNVSFFVLKINDKVLSFLDACITCYTHKQGYRHEGGAVVCRACSQRFSVFTLEKGMGNCYPIKIKGRMENGKYLIPVAMLEAEAGKF